MVRALLCPHSSPTDELSLAPAFSLQISDLRTDIDMLALMKADVKLCSFDIVDARVGTWPGGHHQSMRRRRKDGQE